MNNLDIAIIGISGEFPGARTVTDFWNNLCQGIESLQNLSQECLDKLFPNGNIPKNFIPRYGSITDIDKFDNDFFGIYPKEAALLDPQHRRFLECSWSALEDAGYNPFDYANKIALFAGAGFSRYGQRLFELKNYEWYNVFLGNEKDFLATQVAYRLNFKGPCVTVQTGCSTSLVAVAMACDALTNMSCDLALAGGVYINQFEPEGFYHREGNIFSKDGFCRPFSRSASGTIFTSGVGVVVLKRLEDAEHDKDNIIAVIKGWAINNDGNQKSGFTAPSVSGQAICIESAIEFSGVSPEEIEYVECHGTATQLGDPIEIEALTRVFRKYTEKNSFCALGSVKSNIGHTDIVAGVAGLIKAALSVREGKIPATLHFDKPNPNIDFSNSPFFVNNELLEWSHRTGLRTAGVSSFGIGGTNAHVIVQQYQYPTMQQLTKKSQLFLVSAKTSRALNDHLVQLGEYTNTLIARNESLENISYTLLMGRRYFSCRVAFVIDDVHSLCSMDIQYLLSHMYQLKEGENRQVIFSFPGQGVEKLNSKGFGLFRNCQRFKDYINTCSKLFESFGYDVAAFYETFCSETEVGLISQVDPELLQPTLFSLEYALASTLMDLGVIPKVLIGFSLGEYVAACIAGSISLFDAVKLVSARTKLIIKKTAPGKMVAVRFAQGNLDDIHSIAASLELSVAAISSDNTLILSGTIKNVDAFIEKYRDVASLTITTLATDRAFHSDLLDPILEEFYEISKTVAWNLPSIPYVSNLTGDLMTRETMNDRYWVEHMRHTVLFSKGIKSLSDFTNPLYIEVGPGHLTSHIKLHYMTKNLEVDVVSLFSKTREGEYEFFLKQLGYLWCRGINLTWEALHSRFARKISLPTYPFQRKKFWIEIIGDTLQKVSKIITEEVSFPADNDNKFVVKDGNDSTVELIINCWQNYFGIQQLNINSDFFELGGDSLLAVQMMDDLSRRFNIYLSVQDIFEARCIGNFAKLVETKLRSGCAEEARFAIVGLKQNPVHNSLYFPLSAQQLRTWYGTQLGIKHNLMWTAKINGVLDISILKESFFKILQRHEILRTNYCFVKDELAQYFIDNNNVEFDRYWHDSSQNISDNIGQVLAELFHIDFDLEHTPLIQFNLYKTGNAQYVIAIVMHHILIDGWSIGILEEELSYFYNTAFQHSDTTLPILESQYKDYALWQQEFLKSLQAQQELDYWKQRLAGFSAAEIPVDYPRKQQRSSNGKEMTIKFDHEIATMLQAIVCKFGITEYVFWQSIMSVLIYSYTNANDIVIGTPVAGRETKILRSLIGFFVNILAMRSTVKLDDKFIDLLLRNKKMALESYSHQAIPFEYVVEKIVTDYDVTKTPLFQVYLAVHNVPEKIFQLQACQISSIQVDIGKEVAKFDIAIHIHRIIEGYKLVWNYNRDLFSEERMINMKECFVKLVTYALHNLESTVSDLLNCTNIQINQNDLKMDEILINL